MQISTALALFFTLPLGLASPTFELNDRAGCEAGITATQKNKVQKKFTSSGIVPDLIPRINPTSYVSIDYNGKAVNLGNKFTTAETSMEPTVSFNKEEAFPRNTNYSIFLVDRDVPMEGNVSIPFLHWYFAHAKPGCVKKQSPQTVTLYELPTPGSTTQHRYVYLVYREPAGYEPDVATAQVRPNFDVVTYTKKAGLKLVAGNYFLEAITNTSS